jgi:hypothetical protein
MTPVSWPRNPDIWNVETELDPNNTSREEGFFLNWSWKCVIQTPKERTKVLSKNK